MLVPFGAELFGIAQQRALAGLLLSIIIISGMLARFVWIIVIQGGECLAQIAQTHDASLLCHTEATVEGCAGAAIAVVACIGKVLLVGMLEGETLERCLL